MSPSQVQIVEERDQKEPTDAKLRAAWEHEWSSIIGNIKPLTVKPTIFLAIREAVPFIDRACRILTILDGWIEFDEENTDPRALEVLKRFDRRVPLSHKALGFKRYISQMTDQALAVGFSVGENIPAFDLSQTAEMRIARSTSMCFKADADGKLRLAQKRAFSAEATIIEGEEWLDYLAFWQYNGHPQGIPLAFALPKTCDIMLRILQTLSNTWWRHGSPKFRFHYEGGEDETDEEMEAKIESLKEDAEHALQCEKSGQTVDLYTWGSKESGLSIETWGLVTEALTTGEAWRSLGEMVVCETGLPAWLLGLHWSTTERLSGEQADFMIAESQGRREIKDPLLESNFDRELAMAGLAGVEYKYDWGDINLKDAVAWARVEYMKANAGKATAETGLMLQNLGATPEDIDTLIAQIQDLKSISMPGTKQRDRVELKRSSGELGITIKEIAQASRALGVFGEKQAGSGFPTEIHRNPVIRDLSLSLSEAFIAESREAEENLLKLVGLPSIEKIEMWASQREKGPAPGTGSLKITAPTNAEIDAVFEAWYESVTGAGLPTQEAIDAAYPAHVVRGASAGAKHTRETLAALSDPMQMNPAASILPGDSYVKGFAKEGQKLIKAKITKRFKGKAADVIRAGIAEGKSGYQIGYDLHQKIFAGQDWHWDRLARSEMSMSSDLGNYVEGINQGVQFERWIAAGDACEICAPLDNQTWKFGAGPRPVSDTHPNCMCDKQLEWTHDGETQKAYAQSVPYPKPSALGKVARFIGR